MKPLKSDFSSYVQFTINIEDRLLDFHIEDAFYYSIKSKLGYPADSEKDLALTVYVTAINDAESTELIAFYNNYLKRYWVLLAFKRFLENHGRNVTQFGYTTLRDPDGTFEQVTAEERAVYLKRLQNDINVAETNLFVELNAKRWTYDSFTYGSKSVTPPKKSFGIRAVDGGRTAKRGCNPITEMILPLPSDSDDVDYDNDDYA